MKRSQRDHVIAECNALPGAVEDYPFGDGVVVFKVAGKMFALVSLGPPPGTISLKCNPELALELRAQYEAVTPGYHLNKRHWNTIALDGSLPAEELAELVSHSHGLVVAGVRRADRPVLSA